MGGQAAITKSGILEGGLPELALSTAKLSLSTAHYQRKQAACHEVYFKVVASLDLITDIEQTMTKYFKMLDEQKMGQGSGQPMSDAASLGSPTLHAYTMLIVWMIKELEQSDDDTIKALATKFQSSAASWTREDVVLQIISVNVMKMFVSTPKRLDLISPLLPLMLASSGQSPDLAGKPDLGLCLSVQALKNKPCQTMLQGVAPPTRVEMALQAEVSRRTPERRPQGRQGQGQGRQRAQKGMGKG